MDSTLLYVVMAVLAGIVLFPFIKGYRSPSVRRGAAEAVEAGSPLLDVRTREEFQQGHHPRALNIPVQDLGGRTDRLGDTARPVVVYCRNGNRSAQAAKILAGAGFERVMDLGPMRNIRHISEKGLRPQKGKIPSSRRRRRKSR